MCTICAAVAPTRSECIYSEARAMILEGTGADSIAATAPTVSVERIAKYLTTDYWNGDWRSQDDAGLTTITVNLTGLTTAGKRLARAALEAWESVANITFKEIQGDADITYDDSNPGSGTVMATSNHDLSYAEVNISTQWLRTYGTTYDGYGLQTYIHETGHALGLGHPGPYDIAGTYGQDNIFANDSWQMTVMSYFDQRQNTSIKASFAYAITPMAADIVAIQSLYGAPGAKSVTAGTTVYGTNSTLNTYLGDLFAQLFDGGTNATLYGGDAVAMTLYDVGGYDTINLAGSTTRNRLDLNDGTYSDIGGKTGNLGIAAGTMIERAIGGAGNDTIIGNELGNNLQGNAGRDVLTGAAGNDRILGGGGADRLSGDAGSDVLFGGDANDTIYGGYGADTIQGGNGNDVIGGGGANDLIDGEAGADTIRGGTGSDTIRGGVGNDSILGEDDNDLIYAGTGTNWVDGGAGADRIFGGIDGEVLNGGLGNDRLGGNGGNDALWGGGGADVLNGGAGNDTLGGGWGADTILFARGGGADRVLGFADDVDTLKLNDNLWGGGMGAWKVVNTYASVVNGNTVLDFGNGDVLTVVGVTKPWQLINDIDII